MDYVYICRSGSNEELKYSIRSLIHNCKPTNIWVVGGKPDWYIGNYLEVKDIGDKFQNINNCYKEIINNKNISDNFILMNDDFFILKPLNNFYYYSNFLKDKIINHIKINGNSKYARALNTAVKALKDMGVENPLNYDVHAPMTFNKANLSKVLDLSLAPRSMYGNLYSINPINIEDVKIYKNDINIDINKDFISTEDNSFKLIKDRIKLLFPEPSFVEQ